MGYYPFELTADPSLCRGQFVLSARPALIPPKWEIRTHGRWTLGYSRPLICAPVRNQGRLTGWVLGHAVHEAQGLLDETRGLALDEAGDEKFIQMVEGLTGRFVVFQFTGDSLQAHQDIYGMLAAVYAPEEETVASTGLLIPVSSHTPFERHWILATDIPYRSAMYPVGLTPRRGVERLLPNHVLDLGSWRMRRTWPAASYVQDIDPREVTPRVQRNVRRTLEAVRSAVPLQMPLTAGIDSRLLLACARDMLDDTLFFTADLGDENGWQDVAAARHIAARFGLRHRVFPWKRARRADRRAWAVRTGGETGEIRGWRSSRTLGMQEAGRASITGFVGELARSYWWQRFTPHTVVTPDFILGRCVAPRLPEFQRRAEQWLAGLPPLNAIAVAEVLYLEQRGACWAGVVEYGELGDSALRLPPLGQASLVRDLLRLPEAYRRARRVHLDIIESAWPELLDFPFNQEYPVPHGLRRMFRARQAIAQRTSRAGQIWRRATRDRAWLARRLGIAPSARQGHAHPAGNGASFPGGKENGTSET